MANKRETLCPECGPGASVDLDGCCVQCGATATGSAVAGILAALRRADAAAALLRRPIRRPPGLTNSEWDESRRLLPEYRMDDDEYHVLRLLAGEQISAAKARELIEDIRHGEEVTLPPFEAASSCGEENR